MEELLTKGRTAASAKISIKTLERMVRKKVIPPPVRVGASGRLIRFRQSDIQLWIELGCPDQARFERAKAELALRN